MSVGYAGRLKKGVSYGPCGLPELSSSRREIEWKTKAVVKAIEESKHLVFFTGAGISTSCGIPDFRGPDGVWTQELKTIKTNTAISGSSDDASTTAQRKSKKADKAANDVINETKVDAAQGSQDGTAQTAIKEEKKDDSEANANNDTLGTVNGAVSNGSATATTNGIGVKKEEKKKTTRKRNSATSNEHANVEEKRQKTEPIAFELAVPSLTHMALIGLLNSGHAKFIVSQNVDGLHRRSGVPKQFLSELHGDAFLEICRDCGEDYFRDYDIGGIGCKDTGRVCAKCKGKLRDFVLDWEDPLPESEFSVAEGHCRQADVIICLGTSLRIQPANQLPLLCKTNDTTGEGKKSKLIICNLQRTALHEDADLVIHARCDQIIEAVMKNINIPIPVYSVKKTYCVGSIITRVSDEADSTRDDSLWEWSVYVRLNVALLEANSSPLEYQQKEFKSLHGHMSSVEFKCSSTNKVYDVNSAPYLVKQKSTLKELREMGPVHVVVKFKTTPNVLETSIVLDTTSWKADETTKTTETEHEVEVIRKDYN